MGILNNIFSNSVKRGKQLIETIDSGRRKNMKFADLLIETEVLIEKGADLNVKDKQGRTSLLLALFADIPI